MPGTSKDNRNARGARPHYSYANSPCGIYELFLVVTVPEFASLSEDERRRRAGFRWAGLRPEDREWAHRMSCVVRSHPRSHECLEAVRLMLVGVHRQPAATEDQDDRSGSAKKARK